MIQNAMLFLYGAGVLLLILIGIVIWLHVRVRRLTQGANAQSLEGLIGELLERTTSLEKLAVEMRDDMIYVDERVQTALRGVSVVRFNAFKDSGGGQSFAVSLINESGDGIILSTLYSRERVGVYAKPVRAGKSEFELTDEEKQSLEQSVSSLDYDAKRATQK
mgnify:CR=1 FL=1